MSRVSRMAVVLTFAGLCLAGGMAWWVGGAGAAGPAATAPPGPHFYGVNYTIHTYHDPNFCLDDSIRPASGQPGMIGQCAANDNQHWTSAHSSSGAQIFVDGLGECLGLPSKGSIYIELSDCTFKGSERFYYNGSTGQIQSTNGKLCLQALAAAQDAGVTVQKCEVNPVLNTSLQVWQIGH